MNFVQFILSIILKIFFREVDGFNQEKVPNQGALIFVCAPHANQFIDPLIVTQNTTREIGFLAAAKSMDRKYVGKLIKAMGSIPVKRPQDYRKAATGTVITQDKKVIGTGTKFTSEFKDGASIYVSAIQETAKIVEIVSDEVLTIDQPFPKEVNEPSKIKIEPRIDQNEVYDRVWATLKEGNCIGIFPEGGSHDRASMLPLKAGATIMALGAMAKYDGLDVKIVPCGLNYFKPHRFRSHGFVDFGDPINISAEMVQNYKAGGAPKRKACADLLDMIYRGLKQVTVNTDNHDVLSMIQLVRRLYNPGKKLTVDQKLELSRRFALGYDKYKDDPRVQQLLLKVKEYRGELRNHGVRDYQVTKIKQGGLRALFLLIWRISKLIIMAILSLPGIIAYGPAALVAQHISQKKADEALASSTVKVAGKDVLATWKVLVAGVLLPLSTLFWAGAIAVIVNVPFDPPLWVRIVVPVVSFLILPFIGYSTVRFIETDFMIISSLTPLFWSLCPCCQPTSLIQHREALVVAIHQLVDDLGPDLLANGDRDKFKRIVEKGDWQLSPRSRKQQEEEKKEDFGDFFLDQEDIMGPTLSIHAAGSTDTLLASNV